jgi:hypothetical protein
MNRDCSYISLKQDNNDLKKSSFFSFDENNIHEEIKMIGQLAKRTMQIDFFFSVLTFSFLLLLFLSVSCKTQTFIQCKKIDIGEMSSSSDFCHYFDSGSKIRYGFGENDSIFYLKLEFLDDQVAINALKSGMKVYFDPTDKKSKECYLNFPISSSGGKIRQPPKDRSPQDGSFSGADGTPPSLGGTPSGVTNEKPQSGMADMASELALWSVYDSPYRFNWRLEKGSFDVKLSNGSDNQLVYEALIPISELSLMEGDSTFTVGIEVEVSSSATKQNNNGEKQMGGMGNPPGGGMMPGGSGGLPPAQGMGSIPEDISSGSSGSVNFWFPVHL